uniref:Uncharacterized protein n=1 Tax=Trichogramma kaykai TaxID=54128 RepID=A0ABD2WQ99_9HYME
MTIATDIQNDSLLLTRRRRGASRRRGIAKLLNGVSKVRAGSLSRRIALPSELIHAWTHIKLSQARLLLPTSITTSMRFLENVIADYIAAQL